jgi:hypothetical protein
VYHDSLAIQYCCRAINHGFSLFLDGFVRQRFIHVLPKHLQVETNDKYLTKISPTNSFIHQAKSISDESTPSGIDSISSTYINKKKGLRLLTQQRRFREQNVNKRLFNFLCFNFFFVCFSQLN